MEWPRGRQTRGRREDWTISRDFAFGLMAEARLGVFPSFQGRDGNGGHRGMGWKERVSGNGGSREGEGRGASGRVRRNGMKPGDEALVGHRVLAMGPQRWAPLRNLWGARIQKVHSKKQKIYLKM